ncbi:lysophospholipid acyltransferase family protein [Microbacter margulisiae]|uniref:Putative hemolysin n=1 Tax=Microbacter margulisiae TaxID=1350067 RepID=A0A7W5DQK8_9PORP|nr:lysophospholipid acyltransferase family protein [Microbacter margulisiae]MBB3187237.1 putative hemolysin [Microbacter margulisiae]
MKRTVIDIDYLEKASPLFNGKWGHGLARFLMHFLAIDKVNWAYGRSCDHSGATFTSGLLKDFGVDYRVGNAERLQQLPQGAFITVSNHPYGALDGIMIIDLIASSRPDYKVMVNQILTLIEAMNDNFISVKPRIGNNPLNPSASFNGVKETLLRLKEGHPVGFFPAGGVSFFSLKKFHAIDREWQESILKLIQKAEVPVVPVRFFDGNSPFFYFLGLINWRVRTLRMAHEMFNKKNKHPRIGIGEIVAPEQLAQFDDIRSMGAFLRQQVYGMPKPAIYLDKNAFLNRSTE